MSADRELLELAAKAAGLDTPRYCEPCFGFQAGISTETGPYCQRRWNPLTNDGDALRLAVKLGITITMFKYVVRAEVCDADDVLEALAPDPYAATRRAIVRAAAEIGRRMS